MDKAAMIDTIAENGEDRLLLAKIYDRMTTGASRNIPASTVFLTGREQILAEKLLQRIGSANTCFFGGNEAAERRVLCYIPEYYEQEDYLYSEDSPVCAIRAEISDYDTLTHRDFLGGLMGMGIKRETLGDIYVSADHCDFVVLREIMPYLLGQLTQIGRARVRVSALPLKELVVPEQKMKNIRDTVASLRLDSILAAGFQMGRSKAQGMISAGRVEVNHVAVFKADMMLTEGDVMSVRGLGKMRLTAVNGKTKKDRISVLLDRYL